MMNFLKPIEQFVTSLSKKEFQRYAIIYVLSVIVLIGLLIFWQSSRANTIKKKITQTNSQRLTVREILTEDQEVQHQKKLVDSTLKERKNFKLQHFFGLIVKQLQLQNNLKRSDPFVSNLEQLRSSGYSEVRVEASLVNLNTKQLAELLEEIEKNPIIYVKYLEITKSGKAPAIDVLITIATLQLDKDKMAG
jgi:hypothetical protein